MNTLGRYEIVSELGRGGMGVVYAGRDPKINRSVAIKCLTSQGSGNEEEKKRFAKEMRALGRLIHQNIVTIYDADEDPLTGNAYIVMEHVQGKSLAEILAAGQRLSVKQVREIGVQILTALDFAHEKGIIHRDMKPGNVLLSEDAQTVKLVDFGIARLEEEGFTQTSSFLGTPRYMSPEQCNGDAVGNQSDLFSASAVLYELLTLRKAFSGDSPAAIINQVISHRPDPPMSISKEVPKDLSDAIMKGLEKKPSARFASCREMALTIGGTLPAREESASTLALDTDETIDTSLPTPSSRGLKYKLKVKLIVLCLTILGLFAGYSLLNRPIPVSETPPTPVILAPILEPVTPPNTMGTVDFSVDPAGAQIFVDGNLKGISPVSISLPAGSHEMKIIKEGYDTLDATIDIPAGEKVPVELKLVKQEG